MTLHERLLRLTLGRHKASAVIGDLEEEAARLGASAWWLRREAVRHAASAGAMTVMRTRARMITTTRLAIRDAWRSIWRFKATSAAAVTILALSIAATAVTFAVVDTVVLRPLPYRDSDRLLSIFSSTPTIPRSVLLAPGEYFGWRENTTVFEELAAWRNWRMQLTDARGTENVTMVISTASLFRVLGVQPLVGTLFGPEHEVAGKDNVAVISYGVWQRRFGGDPAALGQSLKTPAGDVTIIGVMPRGFSFPVDAALPPAIYKPYAPKAEEHAIVIGGGKSSYLEIIGLLKRGVPIEEARADVERVAGTFAAQHPSVYTDWRPRAELTLDALTERVSGWMRLVLVAVAMLMAIGCVNISNLLLARSVQRRRDVAVRIAIGATRPQIAAMLVVESVLLSSIGFAIGIAAAQSTLKVIKESLPDGIPRADGISLDPRVLVACGIAGLLAAVVSGLVPGWQGSRVALTDVIKDGGAMTAGPRRRFWQRAFLVTQVALVSTLILASTLIVGSFLRVIRTDLGFAPRNLAGARLNPSLPAGPDQQARARDFYARLAEAVRGVPGVASLAFLSSGDVPLYRRNTTGTVVTLPGLPSTRLTVDMKRVGGGYFETAGIPLLQGRGLTDADRAEPVVIIDEVAARRLFGDRPAVGERLALPNGQEWRIAGVAATVKLLGPEGMDIPQIYRPIDGEPVSRVLVIRTSVPVEQVSVALRTAIAGMMPANSGAVRIDDVEKQFHEMTADRRFNAGMMAALGLLALLIAVSGVYAVTASIVTEQRKEIGIRMALGASASRVVRSIAATTARLLLIGAALGLAGGWAASGLLKSVVFGITATDAVAYFIPIAIIVTTGCLAALLPARRAARVDPLLALRAE